MFIPRIIIVSGPSGAGKTSICENIYKEVNHIYRSVSSTTRTKRAEEIDGLHYHFLTKETFLEKIAKDEFLEYAQVHGNYYGTPKKNMEIAFGNKQDCLVEIDVQGADQIKSHQQYNTLSVFVGLSDPQKIKERLLIRGSETEETIQERMTNMLLELKHKDKYDYYIENICLKESIHKLKNIICDSRCKGNKCGSF